MQKNRSRPRLTSAGIHIIVHGDRKVAGNSRCTLNRYRLPLTKPKLPVAEHRIIFRKEAFYLVHKPQTALLRRRILKQRIPGLWAVPCAFVFRRHGRGRPGHDALIGALGRRIPGRVRAGDEYCLLRAGPPAARKGIYRLFCGCIRRFFDFL